MSVFAAPLLNSLPTRTNAMTARDDEDSIIARPTIIVMRSCLGGRVGAIPLQPARWPCSWPSAPPNAAIAMPNPPQGETAFT
jgi:hypothetical protein